MKLVHQLAVALNQPEEEITLLLQRAPLHYKVYQIPKRTSGTRTIAQPTPELKELQRAFTTLVALPVHQAAMAYRAGLSIKENAQRHMHNRLVGRRGVAVKNFKPLVDELYEYLDELPGE